MAYFGDLNEDASGYRGSRSGGFKDTWRRYKRWIIGGIVGLVLIIIVIACTVGKSSSQSTNDGNKSKSKPILLSTGKFNRPDFDAGKPALGEFNNLASAGGAPKLNENFNYEKNKIRGVNLGGWLVVEPSITPSMFTRHTNERVPDEWTLCEKLGREKCGEVLDEHYRTFISEEDIKQLSGQGINHVRIPIGYWAVEIYENEPFAYGSWDYLLKAIRWCGKYGLRVMIDFHAASGSQNGYASSGQKGIMRLRNNTEDYDARKVPAHRYNDAFSVIIKYFFSQKTPWKEVVKLFNLIDNPAFHQDGSEWNGMMMYHEKLHTLRKLTRQNDLPIISLHDFTEDYHWQNVVHKHLFPGVLFDYRNPILQPSRDVFAKDAPSQVCELMVKRLNISDNDPKVLNGALSLAFNECGTNIDDIIKKTPFTGDCSLFTDISKIDNHLVKEYAQKLISSYERPNSQGWFFWTLKTEDNINPLLSFQIAKKEGWLPTDFSKLDQPCP